MSYQAKAPGAVVTASVLLTIYGALLLICGICGGAGLAMDDANAQAMMKDVPGFTAMRFVAIASTLLVAITMIVCGVGLSQLMAPARIGAYLVLIYQIFFLLMHNIYQMVFVFPATERMVALQMQNQPQPPPFNIANFITGAVWVIAVLGILFHLAFILPTLLLLSSKSSRDAFSGRSQPDLDEDRERRPRRDEYDDDDDDEDRPKSRPKSPGDTGIRE